MLKKTLSFLIIIMFLLSTFACDKNKSDLPQNYSKLYGFESQKELLSIRQQDFFGKYKFNTDKNFVTEGESSLELEVHGKGYGDDKPGLIMYPYLIETNRQNFSKVERVVFDIYNANSSTIKCCFSLTFFVSETAIKQADTVEWNLEPNVWTKCVYDVRYESLAYVCDLSNCLNMLLSFDGVRLDENKPIFYLDNMLVKETNQERVTRDIHLAKNEVCDFENSFISDYLFVDGYGAFQKIMPTISTNFDKKFITSGEQSLKLYIPHGERHNNTFVLLTWAKQYIKTLDKSCLNENYDIVFDIYNDSESMFYLELGLKGERGRFVKSQSTYPKQWCEGRLSLADVYKKYPDIEDEKSYLSNIDSIHLGYGEFVGNSNYQNKDVYIDNIRFEKSGK